MPTIQINNFGGIMPKLHPTLLPENCGQKAHNCVLKSGKLVPLRQPSKTNLRLKYMSGVSEISDANTIFVWHHGDTKELLVFKGLVHVANSNIADDDYYRIFVSGDTKQGEGGKEPCVYMYDPSVGLIYYSLVKEQLPKCNASRNEATVIPSTEENRRYTYFFQTWVDKYGYESGISEPSEEIEYLDKDNITISSCAAPVGSTFRRIYKVVSGTESESIQFVFEQPVVGTTFPEVSFRVSDEDAGEIIPSIVTAPTDLNWLTAVPGGFYVGVCESNKREIRFSEVGAPTSWALEYAYGIHENVVGLAVAVNSVFVLTEGKPYVITGTAPNAMTVSVLASNQGCVSPQSICVMEGQVFYCSADGICMLSEDSSNATVITTSYYSKREWQELKPESSIMVAYDNALYLWFKDRPNFGGLRIEYSEGTAAITTNDEFAKAVTVDAITDKMYFVRRG